MQALCCSRVVIEDGVVVGPGATVCPKDGCTTITVSTTMPALTSSQMLPEDYKDFEDQIIWQPHINVMVQLLSFLLNLILHWIAVMVPITVLYHMFIWNSLTHGWFVVWWFHFYWLAGIPYMFLVIAFKWTVIRRFREGPSSWALDQKRFTLQMLVQSRLLQGTLLLGASSHIITLFFRCMGSYIGWNAQVMPCTVVEFDLLSIGDCVAFGGFVSWFPRDKDGNMRSISVGNYSAVTNSAVVMAGSKIGENSLVGNLTLCKTDCVVPDHTKAVGNPMIQFGNESDPIEINRTRSNVVMFAHLLGSYFIEFIDVPPFLINIFVGGRFVYGPLRKFVSNNVNDVCRFKVFSFLGQTTCPESLGYVSETLLLVPAFALLIVLMVIVSKRFFCGRFSGTHLRDSWIFIQFIYFTKVMVSTDFHVFRFLNGTPFMPLIYNLMGGKMHLSSVLFFRHCADFDELTIGENAVVDFDSYLEMHQKTATELMYEPVEIAPGATVSQRSILLRGSLVSTNSVVSANSTVLPGEEVPIGSIIAMNPGRVIPANESKGGSNDIVKASAKAGRNSVAGNRASTRHAEAAAREGAGLAPAGGRASIRAGGTPGGRASVRAGGRGSVRAGGRASVAGKKGVRRSICSNSSFQAAEKMELGTEAHVDFVVVGAGVCGLVAAEECVAEKKTYMVLEKFPDIMGCWQGAMAANKTSHVAVSEPSYRFNYDHKGKYPSDFTSRDELVADARRYIAAHDIAVTLNANVVKVEEGRERHTVTYVKDNKLHTVTCDGILMALGAQQHCRAVKFDGEDNFEGTISTGIRDHMPTEKFQGAQVVIVGGGAFACENLRTALLYGAEHVTICYRTAMQCWPRVVHYLATLGDTTMGELAKPYNEACKWAGLEGIVEPFMSRKCTAQPTASDMFFMAYKAGRLTLKQGQISKINAKSVTMNDGTIFECDVFMKCLGWHEPPLRKVFPDFSARRFVFLNGRPSITFVSDPHYQHKSGSNRTLAALADLPVKGGTFSVHALATVAIKLQMHFMKNPEDFKKCMAQLPESPEPVCNWFQQRWEFEDVPAVNKIIDSTLQIVKDRARDKFPGVSDYLAMASQRCQSDSKFLSTWPGYMFNMDCTANMYDFPEDLHFKGHKKSKKQEAAPTLQQNAYKELGSM